jgi:putative transposase
MAKTLRTPRAGMSYVNFAAHGRRPIFEISRVAEMFIEMLLHQRSQGQYKLHAYVVMPDHVHLLLTPESLTLDQAVGLIKKEFADQMESELAMWEDGFVGYSVATMHDLEIVRAYLHELPVRANLAPAAELYPYSSAYRRALKLPPSRPPTRAAAQVEQRKVKDA